MTHRYLPMTERDREAMLQEIGVSSVEELFADIPAEVRFKGRLAVSEAMSEPELLRHMRKLAGKNYDFDRYVSFLGAGLYDHHIPSAVNHVISRSEFYTAYTPYQPEISQGELQAIFEFQSYIVELTGMKIANASMYDGATAAAEACALAHGATKRNRIVVSRGLHPEARRGIAVLHALQDAVLHESVEAARQRRSCRSVQRAELLEAVRPLEGIAQDQQRPTVAEDAERTCDWAVGDDCRDRRHRAQLYVRSRSKAMSE